MKPLLLPLACLALLVACNRPNPPPPPKPVAVAPAPPPAKSATMICRSSRTGLKVACGMADAVMVGIKTD